MCGRFVSASPPDELAKYFGVEDVTEKVLDRSFNVAPTNDVYAVLERAGVRHLDVLHWGLVPFWAKGSRDEAAKVGQKMINARAESVGEKPAYKRAFQKRRCLIPADGFYEWKKIPGRKAKQPMYMSRPDGEPFAFAGLWELWRPKLEDGSYSEDESTWLRSCTIITGQPNEVVAPIHDRMPVMLPPSAWETWLDPDNDDVASLAKLLVPAPAELVVAHPVSTRVNDVRSKDSALIEPFDPDGDQGTLLE